MCYTNYIVDWSQCVLHPLHCGSSPSVCYTDYIVDPNPVHVTLITLWTQSQCMLHPLHCGPSPSVCYTDSIVDPLPVRVTLITLWTQSIVLSRLHSGLGPVHVPLIILWTQYMFTCDLSCTVHLGTATFSPLNNVCSCTEDYILFAE